MLVRMTSWSGMFRISALIALFVLSLGACRWISAGVAAPIISKTLPQGGTARWPTGLIINTAEKRLEVNIFEGTRCFSGPGCLAEFAPTNQFVIRQPPALQFFMDASVLSVLRMGGALTTQRIVLPPGGYTAVYCVSYSDKFGCRSGWGPRIQHFQYDQRYVQHYQQYPYDPYLYTKIVTLPWRLDIGVSDNPPLRDFVGFWFLFDLTCVREPWLCK